VDRLGSLPSAHLLADDFDQLASALAEIQAIEQDVNLRELCGKRFRGIQTPFDDLCAVQRWMIEAKRLTPVADDIDRQIRKVLLEGHLETLNAIMALATAPVHQFLEQLLNYKSHPRSAHKFGNA
jgi:hypothetical protein